MERVQGVRTTPHDQRRIGMWSYTEEEGEDWRKESQEEEQEENAAQLQG